MESEAAARGKRRANMVMGTRNHCGRGLCWRFAVGFIAVCSSMAWCRSTLQSPALHLRDFPPRVHPLRDNDGYGTVVGSMVKRLSLRGGAENAASQKQLAVPYDGEIRDLIGSMQSIDNDARSAAEKRFNVLKADSPDVTISGLMQELVGGQSEETRSMAAVLARGQVSDVWSRLSPITQGQLKQQLLGLLQNYQSTETGNAFGRKVANVIGSVTWYSEEGWPDLLPSVIGMCESQLLGTQELGFFVLGIILQHSFVHTALKDKLPQLQSLFEKSLVSTDGNVQLSGMKAIGAFVASCETPKKARSMQGLVSPMLKALGEALQADEERARSGLDVLIEMTDVNPRFFKPQLKEITSAMLQHVAMNLALESSTRRLALEFLVELSERAPKMMKKEDGFLQQVVAVSFAFMVEGVDVNKDMEEWERWADEDDEDDEDDDRAANYLQGLEALDRLAVAFGGASMVPACFGYIPDFLSNQQDWRHRMVGLYGISQTGEGTAKEMRKHLPNIISLVLPMVVDPQPRVRWAAVNCLGQLSTDLGPELQRDFHAQVLPALIAAMDPAREASLRVRAHAAAASINFCEHAAEEVLAGQLSELLRHMSALMQCGHPRASIQATTSVAALSMAVGDMFRPYYGSFMPFLKSILAMPPEQAGSKLRGKAMECISFIGQAVGKDMFRDDAKETMQLIVGTLDHCHAASETSPDEDTEANYMHQACGRICRCLGEEYVAYLPALLPSLLRSANLAPDIKLGDDDDSELEEMETVQVGDSRVGIKTSVLEEKATACHMIVTYIHELGPAFFPYLEQVGNVMKPLMTFWYHEDVRASAFSAMQAMCKSAVAYVNQQQQQQPPLQQGGAGGALAVQGDRSVVKSVLDFVLGDMTAALMLEPEVALQAQCTRAIGQAIGACGGGCLSGEQLAELAKALQQLMDDSDSRVESIVEQHLEDDEDDEDEDVSDEALESEDDLIEQLIFAIGKVLQADPEAFSPHFDGLLRWFIDKLEPSEERVLASFHQRLGLAMIDDVVEIAGAGSHKYIAEFMPHMLRYSRSETSEEVRQAALYGVGLCAEHGGPAFTPFVADATETLLQALRDRDARDDDRESATDNAAASLGKIAQFHQVARPDEVWGAWLAYLPLQADVAESVLVTKQLCALVRGNHPQVLGDANANLPRIVAIFAQVLETDCVDDDCTARIKEMLEAMQQAAPAQLQTACRSLPADALQKLERCIAGTPPPAAVQDATRP